MEPNPEITQTDCRQRMKTITITIFQMIKKLDGRRKNETCNVQERFKSNF